MFAVVHSSEVGVGERASYRSGNHEKTHGGLVDVREMRPSRKIYWVRASKVISFLTLSGPNLSFLAILLVAAPSVETFSCMKLTVTPCRRAHMMLLMCFRFLGHGIDVGRSSRPWFSDLGLSAS
jgi:hypothetical protein